MRITISEAVNTGFQKTHRLKFTGENGKSVKVDLFEDEFKELVDTIKHYFNDI